MLCLPPSCSYSDMCWPWRRREESLSRHRSEKRHYLLPQGNTGAWGNSAISRRERESVSASARKSRFVSLAEQKRVIFFGSDNRASVEPSPYYYYASKGCLHWVWYCLDSSTASIVDQTQWCRGGAGGFFFKLSLTLPFSLYRFIYPQPSFKYPI